MKRIAILGCENSHARNFLSEIRDNEKYSDYEIVGVYSDEDEALTSVCNDFSVPRLENYCDAVGRVDGLIITARHGDNHFKYAKPYIKDGIPMFIDKPITINEDEAIEFMRALRDGGVRISGGSSLCYADEIIALRESVENNVGGKTLAGIFRAPLASNSVYGGFYFYAAHLVEMVCTVFGKYPKSVIAFDKGAEKTVIFRYDEYDITGIYCDGMFSSYYCMRFSEQGANGGEVQISSNWFTREFEAFDALMQGEQMRAGYNEFIYSVFIMNAIERSLSSGKEEPVRKYTV